MRLKVNEGFGVKILNDILHQIPKFLKKLWKMKID